MNHRVSTGDDTLIMNIVRSLDAFGSPVVYSRDLYLAGKSLGEKDSDHALAVD